MEVLVTPSTTVYCTKCGTDLPEDSQFCRRCGQAVNAAPASSATPAIAATSPAPTNNRLERIPLFLAVLVIVALLGWFIDHQTQQAKTTPTVLPSQSAAVPQPPPLRQHRVTIGTGALTVAAANSIYYQLPVPATATLVKVQGHFTATGGTGNDIEVYMLNQEQFINWQNGHPTPTYYNSGRVTVGDIDATLPNDAGTYYLIFNNKFSLITPKAVQETMTMTYFSR
jgi:hypothetical protein